MSFEQTPDGITMGQYYGIKQGTSKEPTSAIAAFFIDTLEDKFPSISDRFGEVPLSYTWFHSGEPQKTLRSPAIGISVAPMEIPTFGSTSISTAQGSIVPGSLMMAEVVMVIVADSPRMREDISGRLFKTINKFMSGARSPLFYVERKGFGDDRGFSSIDRFVMTSLWQNLTEDKYIKIDTYEVGYAENYIDESDYNWELDWGVISNIDAGVLANGIPATPDFSSGVITFKTTFTPTSPFT
jgi:hypothetical protein